MTIIQTTMHPLILIATFCFTGCLFVSCMIGDMIAAGLFLGLLVLSLVVNHDDKVSRMSPDSN